RTASSLCDSSWRSWLIWICWASIASRKAFRSSGVIVAPLGADAVLVEVVVVLVVDAFFLVVALLFGALWANPLATIMVTISPPVASLFSDCMRSPRLF